MNQNAVNTTKKDNTMINILICLYGFCFNPQHVAVLNHLKGN